MENNADLNSSDIEFEPPKKTRSWDNAGKDSIDSMLSRALEERLESKKRVKQLQFVKGVPSTQYLNRMWWNRFIQYKEKILLKGAHITPVGEHIERFLSSIVGHVKPTTNLVPSWQWLQNGLSSVVQQCVFYYKEFKLDANQRSRLKNLMYDLLNDGKITRDPSVERNWVGTVLVLKLATGLIRKALEVGAGAWDNVMQKVLHIVLVAAIACRNHDIGKGQFDKHDLPYLVWKDITIQFVDGETIDHLVAVVVIRNEKNCKLDKALTRKIILKALPSPNDSVLCVVKLLLIQALRLGFVRETSIEHLLENARNRPNKSVVWKTPNAPVLCAARRSCGLLVDTCAGPQQLNDTMHQASAAAGLLKKLIPHDLRRGAARETANLASIKGGTTTTVAAALGHTDPGMTTRYIGDIAEDLWSKRVQEKSVDVMTEIPQSTAGGFHKRKRIEAAAITEYCENESLDPDNRLDRKRAARQLSANAYNAWVANEGEKLNGVQQIPDVNQSTATNAITDAPTEDVDIPIDPQILADTIGHAIMNDNDLAEAAAMEEMMLDHMTTESVTATSPLTADSLSFVKRFSTINITRNSNMYLLGSTNKASIAAYNAARPFYEGNSRDPVSLFMQPCKNARFGCPYAYSAAAVWKHEETCRYISAQVGQGLKEKAAKSAAERTLVCPAPDCGKAFTEQRKLNEHHRSVHDWPRACPKGCDPTTTYDSLEALGEHYAAAGHDDVWIPAICVVPDCKNKTTKFLTRADYRKHLAKVHKVPKDEMIKYVRDDYKKKKN